MPTAEILKRGQMIMAGQGALKTENLKFRDRQKSALGSQLNLDIGVNDISGWQNSDFNQGSFQN